MQDTIDNNLWSPPPLLFILHHWGCCFSTLCSHLVLDGLSLHWLVEKLYPIVPRMPGMYVMNTECCFKLSVFPVQTLCKTQKMDGWMNIYCLCSLYRVLECLSSILFSSCPYKNGVFSLWVPTEPRTQTPTVQRARSSYQAWRTRRPHVLQMWVHTQPSATSSCYSSLFGGFIFPGIR